MTETARMERTVQELLGELRAEATEKGIEAAVAHFTVAVMTDPEAGRLFHDAALVKALRIFLSNPNEHVIHQFWTGVHYDLPGGAR